MSAPSVLDVYSMSPFTECAHCGKFDQAPKVVFGGPWIDPADQGTQWHKDCTPAKVQRMLLEGNINDGAPQHKLILAQTFDACNGGKKDAELLAHILELHANLRPDTGATMITPDPLANAILDAMFNGGASGTVVLGAVSLTLPYKVKWLSTISTQAAAGTEWTGGSYPTGGVSMSGAWGTAAATHVKASTAALTVTNSPALTWADNEIVDSNGTPIRVAAKGSPSLAISVTAGSSASIPSGSGTAGQA